MKKILLFIAFSIIFIAYFLATSAVAKAQNTDSSDSFLHMSSTDSFEYSSNNDDLYTYGAILNNEKPFLTFWTKTGEVVSFLEIIALQDSNQEKSNKNEGQGILSAPSISSLSLKDGGKEHGNSIGAVNALSAAGIALPTRGHPWMFLMTLTFGTVLVSLWSLRFSTGVSPPVTVNKLTN